MGRILDCESRYAGSIPVSRPKCIIAEEVKYGLR